MSIDNNDFTNVLQLLDSFTDRFLNQLTKESLMGTEPWTSFYAELCDIKELLNNPAIASPLDNYKLEVQSPVEKYGIQTLVIALYEDGLKAGEISQTLSLQGVDISARDINQWLKDYSNSSISKKIESTKGSIFDTQTQLQSVFEQLYGLLESLQHTPEENFANARTTKEQVQLEYMREIRQAIKDASTLAATVANMQTLEQFKKIVIEQINIVDPATAHRIWAKVREAKVMFSSLDLK